MQKRQKKVVEMMLGYFFNKGDKMNIIEDIASLKNRFMELNKEEPNCVKLGRKETQELEEWYNEISKPESSNKKVKIKTGAVVMGLCIIKTKNKSFLEVGEEDISPYTWKAVILNPNWKARVEVNNEESNTQTM
jgi:hypothetical protein